MTKGRLLLIGLFPLAVVVALGVIAMLPPSPGVTKANFDRIEMGMTKAQVEEIFGEKGVEIDLGYTVWESHDGRATILFCYDSVNGSGFQSNNGTILDKIRRCLHLH